MQIILDAAESREYLRIEAKLREHAEALKHGTAFLLLDQCVKEVLDRKSPEFKEIYELYDAQIKPALEKIK